MTQAQASQVLDKFATTSAQVLRTIKVAEVWNKTYLPALAANTPEG
jgi:hypothetical protein